MSKQNFVLIMILAIILEGLLLTSCQLPYKPQVREVLDVVQGDVVLWDDAHRVNPDDSQARLSLDKNFHRQGSRASIQMRTSGQDLENKMAIVLEADELLKFIKARSLELSLRYDAASKQAPNKFFLGIADTTAGGFVWQDGLFGQGEPQAQSDGWYLIHFEKSAVLNSLSLSRQYTMYISLWREVVGAKVPIQAVIHFDRLSGAQPLYGKSSAPVRGELAKDRAQIAQQFGELLQLDDDALLNDIQQRTFAFLLDITDRTTGLSQDRQSNPQLASIASSGFVLSALPIGVERGWMGKAAALDLALRIVRAYTSGFVAGHRGFYYHFVDMQSGERAPGSELSSVDTGLLVAGALTAQQYFGDEMLSAEVQQLYNAVEWDWMQAGAQSLAMGWDPEHGFLEARWSHFNEGILLYFLAIASPSHPIPASTWYSLVRPIPHTRYQPGFSGRYIAEKSGTTIFQFQYPLIWLDLRGLEDDYGSYFDNLRTISLQQANFAFRSQGEFRSFQYGVWGISASDGPSGYRAYAAGKGEQDGTIAPYASIASLPASPKQSMRSIRSMLKVYRDYVYRKYGFVSAFNVGLDWFSDDYIGIDQGSLFLMIENYRSGLIWNLLQQNEDIQKAIDKMGFHSSEQKGYGKAINPQFARATAGAGGIAVPQRLRPSLEIPQVLGTIAIDGDLSDWQGIKSQHFSQDGQLILGKYLEGQNLAAQLWAAYDSKFLYLALEVADSQVLSQLSSQASSDFYRSDSVEFYVSRSLTGSPEKQQSVKLAILIQDQDGHSRAIRFGDSQPGPIESGSGIRYAVALTTEGLRPSQPSQGTLPPQGTLPSQGPQGYRVEAAIPLSLSLGLLDKYLDKDLGKDKGGGDPEGLGPGMELAFNALVHNGNNAQAPPDSYARDNTIAYSTFINPWNDIGRWAIATLK